MTLKRMLKKIWPFEKSYNNREFPGFDPRFYVDRYSDVRNAKIDPFSHYANHGWKEGRRPSAGFDGRVYQLLNRDVADANINPLEHYVLHGIAEGRLIGASIFLFNEAYYLASNPDIVSIDISPLAHYLEIGWREGRNPSKSFDSVQYLKENNECLDEQICPLIHFLRSGNQQKFLGSNKKQSYNQQFRRFNEFIRSDIGRSG